MTLLICKILISNLLPKNANRWKNIIRYSSMHTSSPALHDNSDDPPLYTRRILVRLAVGLWTGFLSLPNCRLDHNDLLRYHRNLQLLIRI